MKINKNQENYNSLKGSSKLVAIEEEDYDEKYQDKKRQKNVLHASIGFGTRNSDSELELSGINNRRIRSSSMALKTKFKNVPTIKPVDSDVTPSPINLKEKDTTKYEKFFRNNKISKFNINNINEEKNEIDIMSEDEENISKLSPKNSDASGSEEEFENEEEKSDNIKNTRKKMNKIKNGFLKQKYNDDSIMGNIKQYSLNKLYVAQKYINNILKKKMINQNVRTVSFSGNQKQPPILGFLENMGSTRAASVCSLNIADL